MDLKQISKADLLDILFERRNKEYGAYEIRRKYNRSLLWAMLIAIGFLLACLLFPYLVKMIWPDPPPAPIEVVMNPTTELSEPPQEEVKNQPPPPADVTPPPPPPSLANIHAATHDDPHNEIKPDPTPPPPNLSDNTGQGNAPPPPPPPPATPPPPPPPPHVDNFTEFADQPPTFPGGEGAYGKYLQDHIVYPRAAIDLGIEGTVHLKISVAADGTIAKIEVIGKKVGYGCTEEAIKEIEKTSGMWQPGKIGGKPVPAKVVIPVKFELKK
jgi:protein TonB